MFKNFWIKGLTYFLIFWFTLNSKLLLSEEKPNYKKEKNIHKQILENIFDGNLIELSSNLGERFFVIEHLSSQYKKSILLLHGRGLHPDEESVINPLRLGLFESGFNTYSMQLPVLEKGSTYYDYVGIFNYSTERIQASIKEISKTNKDIIIIAHSCGVHMLMSWIEKYGVSSIDAFVLIGSEATDLGQRIIRPYPFKKIKKPILDIFGEYDYNFVKKNASERFKSIKMSSNIKSSQIEIYGSNHYHQDNSDELLKAVRGWLKTL